LRRGEVFELLSRTSGFILSQNSAKSSPPGKATVPPKVKSKSDAGSDDGKASMSLNSSKVNPGSEETIPSVPSVFRLKESSEDEGGRVSPVRGVKAARCRLSLPSELWAPESEVGR
jgi:hypothetical protein